MELNRKKIVIKEGKDMLISLADLKEEQELMKKFVETSYSSLEMKFGNPEYILIKKNIDQDVIGHFAKNIGGNNNHPVFACISNINNNKYITTITVIVQKQESPKKKKCGLLTLFKRYFSSRK